MGESGVGIGSSEKQKHPGDRWIDPAPGPLDGGGADRPIASYALLSDCRSAALVGSDGSIDWYCVPRFDGPALFGALLDRQAGSWSIRPAPGARVRRRYLDRSLVLETTFTTSAAVFVLEDALAILENAEGHELGREAPRVLLRRLRCVEGAGEVRIAFRPRPEFGLVHPLLHPEGDGLAGRGGAMRLVLSSSRRMELEPEGGHATLWMNAGDQLHQALQHRTTSEEPPRLFDAAAVDAMLETTAAAWRHWSEAHQRYEAPWWEEVAHGGRVLQGLTYQPTGAMIAAATTSLPEARGAGRNWDYRFTWLRDASLTLDALWVAACPDEAHRFFDFLAAASLGNIRSGEPPQIMYGVGGEHDLSERELPHLAGWSGSRPVRVGNDAWRQRQLDTYGEVLGAALRLREQLGAIDASTRSFLRELADAAALHWREPDHGIWEQRQAPRHYLHSKLMCWVALDAACKLVDVIDGAAYATGWGLAAEEIRTAILADGVDPATGAFTQAFGSRAIDAAALVVPIVGFLPGDDPRVLATIAAVRRELLDERGLVRRYATADGMAGSEGSFLLCTFWLAHALALAGRLEEAEEILDHAAAHANDVGLLPEEIESQTGEAMGNFPQAFSHIGLINARWALAEAKRRAGLPG